MMSLNLPVGFQVDDKALDKAFDDLLNNIKGSQKAFNDLLGGEERVEFKIDTKINDKGLIEFEKRYEKVFTTVEKVNQEIKKQTATQKGSVTSLRQSVNQAKKWRDSLAVVNTETGKINVNFIKANLEVKRLNQQLRRAESAGRTGFDKLFQSGGFQQLTNISRGINI